ncbi:MAG: hypothetical protein ACYC5V_13200 [Gemmatimonadaceae bacterium]
MTPGFGAEDAGIRRHLAERRRLSGRRGFDGLMLLVELSVPCWAPPPAVAKRKAAAVKLTRAGETAP